MCEKITFIDKIKSEGRQAGIVLYCGYTYNIFIHSSTSFHSIPKYMPGTIDDVMWFGATYLCHK